MSKNNFPIFEQNDLVYLDSASTSQKPQQVIDAMNNYYSKQNANTSRGAYELAVNATELFEKSRETVQKFINAKSSQEVIFTKGTTEAINLIAYSYGLENIEKGDEIALLISEHHANLLPWQNLCKQKGGKLVYLYLDENFEISDKEINEKITSKTKIVACAMVSNVLGIINPVEKIIKRAHQFGAVVVVDGAQSVSHMATDVQKLDADFFVFSGHKMYGPMGIGVLYGKKDLLNNMTPFLLGGDMVEYVYEDSVTFNELPHKFEGGTQNVGGAIGLASAIDFINDLGFDYIEKYIGNMFDYATKRLEQLDFITIIGKENKNRTSIISFLVDEVHPHDMSSILDSKHICVRSGNHCAQPLLRKLGINSTTRISFGIYNTKDHIDRLIEGIIFSKELFSIGQEQGQGQEHNVYV